MKQINSIVENSKNGKCESEWQSKNKVNVFSDSAIKCFVCDKSITMKSGINLMMGSVPYSKTGLPKKIGELMGDGFMIIINERDLICRRCSKLINHVDKLEVDLDAIKRSLTGYLKAKYNLLNSNEADLLVSDAGNSSFFDEVTESPQFDALAFQESTNANIQSTERDGSAFDSSIQQEPVNEEVIKVETENSDFENDYVGYMCETVDSEESAECFKASCDSVQFKCSECHQCFENQSEAEEHLNSHLKALNTIEADTGKVNNSNTKLPCYQCHVCKFQTQNKMFLEKHLTKHLTKPVYECTLCSKRFKSKRFLLKHMTLHQIFKCGICSQTFHEKRTLLKHLTLHKQNRTKAQEEATENEKVKITKDVEVSMDHEQDMQSKEHHSDVLKKDCLGSETVGTENNLQDSVVQNEAVQDSQNVVDYDKIEELMAKMHADDMPCSSSEGNDANACQKIELMPSTGNESNIEFENNDICHLVINPNILIDKGTESQELDKDKADILKLFNDENSVDSNYKEQEGKLQTKWRIFICSVCGLKSQSVSEIKKHLKKHLALENRTYECHICTRIFTSQFNLKRHLSNHGTSFQKITCTLCNEELMDRLHLRQHMTQVHTVPMRCFYCSQVFISKKELKEHELAHPENATHRCNLCKKRFITEIRLKIHMKNIHTDVSGNEIFKCSICSKSLTTVNNLKRHLRNHQKSERNAKCNICSEMLTDKLHLRQHMEDVHADIYQCPFCQQTFSNRKLCKTHELTHPERYIYKCENCPLRFVNQAGLDKHNSFHHRDPHCKFCNKQITDPMKLLNHERRHEMYKNKFPCKQCPKVFRTPSGLKYHMSTHTGKYAVYCEICGKGMHSEIVLEEHKATHTKEPRYTCDVCGRSFTSKSTYRVHRKWHDDPLPYRCKFCNRKFKHSSILAVHIRRAHTGERPYKCPHCPHTFSVSSTLHKHIILHTKKYPYICKYCNKGFTTRSKVAWHLAKGHNDYEMVNSKPPPCEYKMALKPSEMPPIPTDDNTSKEQDQQSSKPEVSQETFEEMVIEENIVNTGQIIFLFQEGLA